MNGDIQSPLSPQRYYGGAQPTELLLLNSGSPETKVVNESLSKQQSPERGYIDDGIGKPVLALHVTSQTAETEPQTAETEPQAAETEPQAAETEPHAVTWIDEVRSSDDEEMPTATKESGARGRNRKKKKAADQGSSSKDKAADQGSSSKEKAADQGSSSKEKAADQGSSSKEKAADQGSSTAKKSRTKHLKKTQRHTLHSEEIALQSGITRIDDVVPEGNHDPDEAPVRSSKEVRVVVVEMHGQPQMRR